MYHLRRRIFMVAVVLALGLAARGAAAQGGRVSGQATTPKGTPARPCCEITSIDSTTGIVTAKNNATGTVFFFRAVKFSRDSRVAVSDDSKLIAALRVGQAVYTDILTGRVSLSPGTPCCAVVGTDGKPAKP